MHSSAKQSPSTHFAIVKIGKEVSIETSPPPVRWVGWRRPRQAPNDDIDTLACIECTDAMPEVASMQHFPALTVDVRVACLMIDSWRVIVAALEKYQMTTSPSVAQTHIQRVVGVILMHLEVCVLSDAISYCIRVMINRIIALLPTVEQTADKIFGEGMQQGRWEQLLQFVDLAECVAIVGEPVRQCAGCGCFSRLMPLKSFTDASAKRR
mmetsp:Transcript_43481/g.108571  ORF Transcript_43481/g.108571 Transcript_43481/m.108571 type:complete len:210 (+) Transcript_43481:2170-2799(+)